MIILVCGYDRSGKTTFAGYLAEALGGTVANTSDWLIELLRPLCPQQASETDEDYKSRVRPQLRSLGNMLCAENPRILYDAATQWTPTDATVVVTGCRRAEELGVILHPVMGWMPPAMVCWIERDGCDPGNCTIDPTTISEHIDNNGTLEDLRLTAGLVAQSVLPG